MFIQNLNAICDTLLKLRLSSDLFVPFNAFKFIEFFFIQNNIKLMSEP